MAKIFSFGYNEEAYYVAIYLISAKTSGIFEGNSKSSLLNASFQKFLNAIFSSGINLFFNGLAESSISEAVPRFELQNYSLVGAAKVRDCELSIRATMLKPQ